MGAGPPPLEHPRRPPIPMVALDESAMAAVRAQLETPLGQLEKLAVWLAGVTGDEHPAIRARVFVAGGAAARGVEAEMVLVDPPSGSEPVMSVFEVARAVDAGRELTARAAGDGITLVAGAATSPRAAALAAALANGLGGGPLRALHHLGDPALALLCGVALGAGEHGLGYVCDGLAATTGAAVAAGIEPGLRPRLLAADRGPAPEHGALLAHFGLEPVVDLPVPQEDGSSALAALAVLRAAATLSAPGEPGMPR
jgi:nicotinate-nucleotide--dimethylbenzimidazole phosphoribosyltransferase